VSTGSPIGKAIVALATLAVASATLAFGAAQAGPASAATGPCVAVVVDFRHLGGQVQTGCAQGDPSSGLRALGLAGFAYRPRPDGLICQIDSRPACTDTTSSRYWSYWYRAAGSSHWVYASEGPGTHNPKPGSTEGWVWQDGGRTPPPDTRADTICPQLAATPSPKPTSPKPTHQPTSPATTPTSEQTHRAAGTPVSPASTSAGRVSSAATTSPTTGSLTSSSGTSSSTSAAVAPPSDAPTSGVAAPNPAEHGGGGALGGAAGVALGSAVVLGIGAATVVRARRGRSP
jgi:hypothetical protein